MDALDLVIVVNGQPVVVKAHEGTHLRKVVEQALAESGNVGQPPENWELRDAAGVELDQQRTVKHYKLENGVKLFLNLRAGVGG
jgi:hypothetical protein